MSNETTAGPAPGTLRRLLPVAAILALALGLWLGLSHFQADLQRTVQSIHSGTLLPHPRPLKPFTLIGSDGQAFTLEDLKQGWHFIAIGYTSCPDICSTTLTTFDAIAKATESATDKPGFLFVSVDPERDSPEQLGQFVHHFNKAFLAATGAHTELQSLTRQLGMLYHKEAVQDPAMGYMVDHSAGIMLVDPLGRLAAIFSAPHDPAAMAQDYLTITQ